MAGGDAETTRHNRRRAIVKRNPHQLSLFPPRGALPSHPFSLAPSPDEIRICSGCGKPIITQRRTTEGEVVSEFVSAAGECVACSQT